jgi:hypothetical protein
MKEIIRTETLNMDRYIEYLDKNGLIPSKNPLASLKDKSKKNVAGINITDIPAISDNNIVFDKQER